jgi:hypothetical protein
VWSSRWNENWQEKPKYSEKTCPSATLSTTNPTSPDPSSNPGRSGGKPATDRLSYGTAHNFTNLRGNVHVRATKNYNNYFFSVNASSCVNYMNLFIETVTTQSLCWDALNKEVYNKLLLDITIHFYAVSTGTNSDYLTYGPNNTLFRCM